MMATANETAANAARRRASGPIVRPHRTDPGRTLSGNGLPGPSSAHAERIQAEGGHGSASRVVSSAHGGRRRTEGGSPRATGRFRSATADAAAATGFLDAALIRVFAIRRASPPSSRSPERSVAWSPATTSARDSQVMALCALHIRIDSQVMARGLMIEHSGPSGGPGASRLRSGALGMSETITARAWDRAPAPNSARQLPFRCARLFDDSEDPSVRVRRRGPTARRPGLTARRSGRHRAAADGEGSADDLIDATGRAAVSLRTPSMRAGSRQAAVEHRRWTLPMSRSTRHV
jgi:hypothetical protein